MLRSVPASVAFEPRSKNKKKGDKKGGFRGDLRGKESYPPRAFDYKSRDIRSGLNCYFNFSLSSPSLLLAIGENYINKMFLSFNILFM